MRHSSVTTRQLESPSDGSWVRDRVTGDACAWFKGRLRWECRLAELRARPERAYGAPTASRDRRPDGAER